MTEFKSTSASFSALHEALPKEHQDADGPVFKAPWEAQAFAMTLVLHDRGVFTWSEWANTLAQAIRDAQAAGDPDTGESYYQHWLVALERITTEKKLLSEAMLACRKQQWEDAARHTPHGQLIKLDSAVLRAD